MKYSVATAATAGIIMFASAGSVHAKPAYDASGRPDGQGSNACHQIWEAGYADSESAPGSFKINVGNPDQVLLAGDCDGGEIWWVDDGLTVDLTNPTRRGGGEVSVDFYDECGGSNIGGPAIDVSDIFKPGTNTFELAIDNDCGGTIYASDLYLVVVQHAG